MRKALRSSDDDLAAVACLPDWPRPDVGRYAPDTRAPRATHRRSTPSPRRLCRALSRPVLPFAHAETLVRLLLCVCCVCLCEQLWPSPRPTRTTWTARISRIRHCRRTRSSRPRTRTRRWRSIGSCQSARMAVRVPLRAPRAPARSRVRDPPARTARWRAALSPAARLERV